MPLAKPSFSLFRVVTREYVTLEILTAWELLNVYRPEELVIQKEVNLFRDQQLSVCQKYWECVVDWEDRLMDRSGKEGNREKREEERGKRLLIARRREKYL